VFLIAFSKQKCYIIYACFEKQAFSQRNFRPKPRLNTLTHGKIYPKNGGVNMSRVCNNCGKGQATGNNVSHSNRKTRRTFKVNVQKISYVEDGKETNGYVCARCIRTLKKAD
jgi:large subunit ribosomal protein L28